jgi:hypothetical protein
MGLYILETPFTGMFANLLAVQMVHEEVVANHFHFIESNRRSLACAIS